MIARGVEGLGVELPHSTAGVLSLLHEGILELSIGCQRTDRYRIPSITAHDGRLQHFGGEISRDIGQADRATCLLDGDTKGRGLDGCKADKTLVADGRQRIGRRDRGEASRGISRLDTEALDSLAEGDVLLQGYGIELRRTSEAEGQLSSLGTISTSPVGLQGAIGEMLGEEGLARALVRRCRDNALQEIPLEGSLEMIVPSDEMGQFSRRLAPRPTL